MSRPAAVVQKAGPVPFPSGTSSGWIANASYDGWFFVGSIALCVVLVAIAIANPALAIPATIVAGVLFANTHNLLTGFFFLDPENLAYYRRYPHYYFTAPLALLGASMAIFVWSPPLAFTLHFFFTTWHVVRQSVGVQKLYLGRLKATDFDRNLDACLIYAAVFILHVFAIWKFRPLWATKAIAPEAVHAAGAGLIAGAVALLAATLLVRVLWLGRREGRVAWQRLGFGLTSIGMYTPYLVIDQYQVAFMAGILPHYMQYHGIFWLVGQNKYAGNAQYDGTLLGRLARDLRVWVLLVVVAAAIMALFRAPYFLADKDPVLGLRYAWQINLAVGFFYGLGWMHFYLDGLLFRFRYPEVRAAILRHLHDPRSAKRAAA
jgi:hypothetical protein